MAKPSEKEEAIFAAAVEMEDRRARDRYLDAACGDDTTLRASVEQLLALHDTAGDFLETPPLADSSTTCELRAGMQIDNYQLMELIGEGGFGVVWRAEQLEPIRREVALKIIKPGWDSQKVMARFESERQTLAMMNHPNIAMVLDAGAFTISHTASPRSEDVDVPSDTVSVPAQPYFAMELVNGPALDEYCDEHELNLKQRLALFLTVCRAVQHAHQKGIIHRDLKPSNVLVATDDGRPLPKVIDFGIAKAIGDPGAVSDAATCAPDGVPGGQSQLAGTLGYMSPEQLTPGKDVDTRSDVYALGAVLYKLMTGTTPFARAEGSPIAPLDLVRQISAESPKPLAAHARAAGSDGRGMPPGISLGDLGPELDWILAKSLAADPNDRYASASELAADIERFLKDRVISVAPAGHVYRIRKTVRRNRVFAVASLLVVFGLVGGGIAATIGLIQARRHAEEAHVQWRRAEGARRAAEQARTRSELERQRAADEAAKAHQVVKVLEQLIGASHRDEAHPADYTLRETLDEFSATLTSQLDDQPEVEAVLRRAIGRSYLSIGETARAGPLLERAVELSEQLYHADHPMLAKVRVDYALYLLRASRFEEAEEMVGPAEDVLRPLGPSDELFWAIYVRSRLSIARGQTREAARLCDELYQIVCAVHGPDHPLALQTLCHAATLVRASPAAEQTARQALARLQAMESVNPSDVSLVQRFLSQILIARGKYEEAVALAQSTLDTDREMFGDANRVVLNSTLILAQALRFAGRNDEALAAARDAVRMSEQITEPNCLLREAAYLKVARLLEKDDPKEADKAYQQAIAVRRRATKPNAKLVQLLRSYGTFRMRQGNWRGAVEALEEAAAIARRGNAPSHVRLRILLPLSAGLDELGEVERRSETLREGAALDAPPSDPLLFMRFDLLDTLLERDDTEAAQQWIVRWREQDAARSTSAPQWFWLLTDAHLAREAVHYEQAGQLARDAVDRIVARQYPRSALAARILLAQCLADQRRYSEAETTLLALARRVGQIPIYEQSDERRVARALLALYQSWNQPDKAKRWQDLLAASEPASDAER